LFVRHLRPVSTRSHLSVRMLFMSSHHCFFFACPRDHRDLHSFPTRRSSDLGEIARGSDETIAESGSKDAELREAKGGRSEKSHRSEEHTSELQSPDHLVCRLLLEKKKNRSKH